MGPLKTDAPSHRHKYTSPKTMANSIVFGEPSRQTMRPTMVLTVSCEKTNERKPMHRAIVTNTPPPKRWPTPSFWANPPSKRCAQPSFLLFPAKNERTKTDAPSHRHKYTSPKTMANSIVLGEPSQQTMRPTIVLTVSCEKRTNENRCTEPSSQIHSPQNDGCIYIHTHKCRHIYMKGFAPCRRPLNSRTR